jgi:ribosomal protein S18 acetylase RimI-like enzyme
MQVRKHEDPRAFLEVVGDLLRRRVVMNQIPLSITNTCITDPARYGAGVVFYSVDNGGLAGAAVQTPPWPVQIAECTPEGAALLGRTFASAPAPVEGVIGAEDQPAQFAEAYGTARRVSFARSSSMGVFELRAVADVRISPGRRVIATDEHVPIIQAWVCAFHDEATPHDPAPQPNAGARAVGTGRVHLWLDEHGTPVSYAVNNRNVEGWSSLGPVYTPPPARGRGYATSLVASASRELLASGSTGCTLFTDLANPTSNAIYERIGYRRVGTANRYAFTGAST